MSTNEQLAWDFDDGDAAEIRPDEGVTRFAPGSEQWVAALDATDDDAMRSIVLTSIRSMPRSRRVCGLVWPLGWRPTRSLLHR